MPRPWRRALAWLLFLGPFFFATYGFANWWTSRLASVPAFFFGWERSIPFLPWTIVPYWSEDLFYAGSLFLCRTRGELDRHGLRLVLASVVSVAGFLVVPLRFSFERPETAGLAGALFELLGKFDQPFNQAPSLHVSLLMILWARYAAHLAGARRWLLHAWFLLIGLSVLTTYQHHVIDVLTAVPVGVAILYAVPDEPLRWRLARPATARHVRLAAAYGGGALLLLLLAMRDGWWTLAGWPAAALALVAAGYARLGPAVFQKRAGRLAWPAAVLLLPFLLARRLVLELQARRLEPSSEVVPGLSLGRWRWRAPEDGRAVLDLAAELPGTPAAAGYAQVPMLDLVAPPLADLREAVERLAAWRREGRPVLVHCALGLSRSALVVAAWLLGERLVPDPEAALARLRAVRPAVGLNRDQAALLDALRPRRG